MNSIAVIICNYNGGKDTLNCIESVLTQTYEDIDIYVVDNASTDASVEMIQKKYANQVTILLNERNMGGSGGFGRGIRYCLEKKYEYLVLIDNDAIIASNMIELMYKYMDEHQQAGVVGAKILMLDDKDRIFDYAKTLDFDNFEIVQNWYRRIDCDEAQIPRECDLVAATACMYRGQAIIDAGGMDEEHFIYYDDIDLSWRTKLSGYQVISLGEAKAWHRSGSLHNVTNTFATYYFNRNRYRFFAKYISDANIEKFVDYVIEHIFPILYGSHNKGKKDTFETMKYVFDDFLHDVRGKAGNNRIQTCAKAEKQLSNIMNGKNSVEIYMNADIPLKWLARLTERIYEVNSHIDVIITLDHCGYEIEECKRTLAEKNLLQLQQGQLRIAEKSVKKPDVVLRLCKHVKDIKNNILPEIYLDIHYNDIRSEEDYYYFKNYANSLTFFKHLYREQLFDTIYAIRQENKWL